MPDIVSVIYQNGERSLPIVGTLGCETKWGRFVVSNHLRYLLPDNCILECATFPDASKPLQEPKAQEFPDHEFEPMPMVAPIPEPEPEPVVVNVDPANPYEHLSPMTRKMLQERDAKLADAGENPPPPPPVAVIASAKKKRRR